MTLVEFKDFYWKYKTSKGLVLNNINLKINKGEFLGIMGPTGAGKSTLCSSINGLIPLRTRGYIKGSVEVFGKNTRETKMAELGQHVGLVFQDPETQFIMMSVEDEIAIGLETLNLDREEMRKRIKWSLEIVGLEGFENRSPDELSGGQKQRVAIASILAMRPDIIILDEPTSDLDSEGKYEVFETLEKIKDKFNLTIVLVSHETEKIVKFCDRVILLNEGIIKFDGKTSELENHLELLEELGIYVPSIISKSSKSVELEHLEHMDYTNKLIKKSIEPIIEISNLSFQYPNGTQALQNVSFSIYQGDFIAIIGRNGSGKTTLIKNLYGLLTPEKGSIKFYDKNIEEYKSSEIAQKIGFCFQNPDHQLVKNTIKDEIEFTLRNFEFEEEEIKLRYDEMVKLLDLRRYEEEYSSTFYLSKGIRQRLALGSVLVLKPDILIVDEPTTGQSYNLIVDFMKILQDLNKENKTIIIITHDPRVIAHYSKEVIVLEDGKLLAKCPTLDFLKDKDLQKRAAYRFS
ncbi:MAG: hypothetical protein BAJALOKI2v1_90014 [Promethearchaeota archaeon]|nr:MAG: hypothetical protein BAJALOKI2v1_90014 [Candidatus Lokiarchaeota archaeon]